MTPIEILHHGGRETVTGSCHELRLGPDWGVLVDCGLFQGDEAPGRDPGSASRAPEEIDFPVAHLRALVLTHVHLDHSGRIPYLLAAGFDGPIYCSHPSAILLPLMLEDALKVGVTRDRRRIAAALARIRRQLVPLAYGQWQELPVGPGVEVAVKLRPAGHILGSASAEFRVRFPRAPGAARREERRLLFSGDLGAPYAPLLPAPRSPYGCDLLVLEATYGDRRHEDRRRRRRRLREVLERALADGGTVLVPAFALGRTQELLYELEDILHRNRERFAARGLPWRDLEIVLDSPLATRLTRAYRELAPWWDAEARRRLGSGRRPLAFEQLTVVESHADHEHAVRTLARHGRPCVVVASSGMCTGGRIVNYLAALVGDPRTDVLLVGYQAAGTPGRQLQEYGPRGGYVVLDGRRHDIRARIHTLAGYSAHADRQNLVDFVRRMRKPPAEIRLVHGERGAREALAAALRSVCTAEVRR